MEIKILGTGCPKCKALEANARDAVKQAGIDAQIEKVTDLDKIMDLGVMMTPGLVINGEVKSIGKVPGVPEITELLKGAN